MYYYKYCETGPHIIVSWMWISKSKSSQLYITVREVRSCQTFPGPCRGDVHSLEYILRRL